MGPQINVCQGWAKKLLIYYVNRRERRHAKMQPARPKKMRSIGRDGRRNAERRWPKGLEQPGAPEGRPALALARASSRMSKAGVITIARPASGSELKNVPPDAEIERRAPAASNV